MPQPDLLPPGDPALTSCARCGVFLMRREDLQLLFGKLYCTTCSVRPDVDHLEAFRLKYWGKRDSWAWLVGIGTPVTAVTLAGTVAALVGGAPGMWVNIPGQVASLIFGVAFFLGQRWARFGMLVAYGLNLLLPGLALMMMRDGEGYQTAQVLTLTVAMVLGSLVWFAIIRSTLNKLFFKLDVSRDELQKAWHLFANNTLARAGFLLGLLSLLAWPLGALALPLSIAGLTRVDPNATPPIGRKGQAIAGIVCSTLGLFALVIALVTNLFGRA